MSSKAVIGLVVAVVVIGGGAYLFMQGSGPSSGVPAPSPLPSPAPTPSAAPSAAPTPAASPTPSASSEQVIEITSQGFSPSAVTVPVNTAVRFVNRDSVPRWPASGVHPTHQVCPGFDALEPVQPGASYTFTFRAAKACPMHDHLNPETRGTITVQ